MPRAIAILIALLVSLLPSAVRAQEPPAKRVVVLYWYDKNYSWNVGFDQAFQNVLHSTHGNSVEYYPEYLESNKFPGENQSVVFRDYLRKKYADRTIDAVVASSDASLEFLLKYRTNLFPNIPIVFIAARHPGPRDLATGLTGIINISTHRATLDLLLRLQPHIKEVFVVTGTLEHDGRLETFSRDELHDYEGGVKLTYLTDYTPDELVEAARTFPENSAVLFVWQQALDADGKLVESPEILSLLAASTRVPVYGMSTPYVGRGIVGGYINTAAAGGAKTAEMVVRMLNGAAVSDIPVENAPAVPIFDWRELRRWGINEDLLPADSIIRFRESSLWDQYKGYVIGAIALILIEAALIGGLLAERRKRQRAEEGRQRLASIVESSKDAIIGVSLDGEIQTWNTGAEAMYGHTSAEMVGRNIDTIVPPDRWLEHSRNIAKLQGGEGVSDYETVRLTKDGSRLDVSVSVSPIRDAKGRTIAAASIARDVTARKRVEQQLERLTQRLLTLQDSERRRLARELHDVTAQNLFAMSISLSRLQQPRMHQSEDALLVLAECGKLCEQALQEIRTLSYVLHPPMLDLTGLPGALRWYVAGFTKRSGINVEMLSKDEIGRLPTDIETALFRVVQECLSNIRRHSGSNQATIRLERLGDRVVLQIRDYGRGMPDSIAVETDGNESLGVGIPGMRQRLHQLGGVLDIESTERGMVVTATVPISAEVLNDPNLNGDLEEKQKETG